VLGIQALVQPTEPCHISARVLHRARKPGQYSLIGGECFQSHCREPGALPGHQGGYLGSQPVFLQQSKVVLIFHDNSVEAIESQCYDIRTSPISFPFLYSHVTVCFPFFVFFSP
jgi:hypothetical protein